ncbi:MAG: acyl carrier protein [Desulfobacteraceae bacterium]|nr:MAG: acyl carrier protein [Desulfobacteraceae bacterium]
MSELEVFQVIKRVTLEVLPFLPPDHITIEKNLKELGANSIDRMEVVTRSMEELGIKVPLVEFGKVKDLGGLVNVFHRFTN